jgi:DNA anti-recombination protein RmuC
MSVDVVDILIYLVIFIIAFGLSMMLLERIAKVLFSEFYTRFDEQVNLYKKHTNDVLKTHLSNIDTTVHFKDEIVQSLENINEEIYSLHKQLKNLNDLCQNREELENEILKLKNILKRKEKNL